MRLRDKVALLSGVGLGMGRATALLFAREGASVVLSARRQEPLEETASLIGPSHGGTTVVPGDVSVKSEAERVVTRVVDEYGRLDILYCGAGGFFEPGRDFGDVDQAYWQGVLDNTANSLYNLAQAVSPVMRGQGGGSIVSVAASFSVRQAGNPAYGAAKGGVIGLGQSLAIKLYPDNVRVNTIAPGLFRDLTHRGKADIPPRSLARTGHHADIAYAALYLASDEAAWVTGQVLTVDGGVDAGTRPLWEYET